MLKRCVLPIGSSGARVNVAGCGRIKSATETRHANGGCDRFLKAAILLQQ